MKFAIIGYGKMGHIIEETIHSRGHEVSVIIDTHNPEAFDSEAFRSSDAAIEFSVPSAAFDNVCRSLRAGVATVCGTTAWTARLDEAESLCRELNGAFMYASNYSIGVNIFRALSNYLTDIMRAFPQYGPSLHEVHHIHKLDHPSGTAVTLAEDLVSRYPALKGWNEPENAPATPDLLPITHERRGEVPGIHSLIWNSDVDSITITHSAKSRHGFALGAVMAAEWLATHPGVHTIGEMLSDITHTQNIF